MFDEERKKLILKAIVVKNFALQEKKDLPFLSTSLHLPLNFAPMKQKLQQFTSKLELKIE